MDRATAFARFCTQRRHARARGIEWQFTFDQWLAWWGDDLDRRGSGYDKLQMQRVGDQGPYAPDNVRKGYPRDNGKTFSAMQRHRNSLMARAAIEAAIDAAETVPYEEKDLTEDERVLQNKFGIKLSFWHHF